MYIGTGKSIDEKRNIEIKMKNKKLSLILKAACHHLGIISDLVISGSGTPYVDLKEEPRSMGGRWYGYKTPRKMRLDTLQYNTLRFIWEAGEKGIRYTDIQRFMVGPELYDRMRSKSVYNKYKGKTYKVNQSRGHYSTWLSYHMPMYSENIDNKWVLTHPVLKRHFESRFQGWLG
jgi:hypothetical protein